MRSPCLLGAIAPDVIKEKQVRIRSWRVYLLAVTTTMAVFLVACGGGNGGGHEGMDMGDTATTAAGGGGTADRTVDVNMVDIAFEPKELTAKKGESVKFVFHNTGKVAHEALFGDKAMQDEHEKEMGSTGSTMHDMAMNQVQPGESRTVTYTFDNAGTTIIGCHEPGHYAAGMKINVTVE